ncbi:cell adhesion molecule Dscam1-like isoform X2 [Dermacentor albipictus]|uniref:cell adhesion molecule Dscam1-like isoform X2 n=1 Tax=Dermacentor albipictus TaxID=60249 RepID=UPI0038FCD648
MKSRCYEHHGLHAVAFLATMILYSNAAEKPKLQPLVFPRSRIRVGESASALCALVAGDHDVKFRWFKENVEIGGAVPNVKVKNDKKVSVLTVEPATIQSAGNYTCTAENNYGTDANSATLVVEAIPQWTAEPKDASVTAGQALRIECSASGFPVPNVYWRRIEPGKDASKTSIATGSGSTALIAPKTTKDTEGKYICEADNGIGAALKKIVFVKVKLPAKFTEKHSVVTARRGENARLVCDAQGDQPLTVAWSKGVQKIDRGGNSRLEIFETMTDSGLRSELFISSTERSDGAVYTCRAENEFGHDERTSKLLVVEVPGQPQDVKVSETWSRSASVSWSPPYSGNSPVAKYVIQYWKDSGTAHRLQEVAVPGSQTSALVGDLHPGSTYHLSILAENSVGVGLASTPVKLHTGEEEPSAAPTDFHVEARGPSTVRVSWKPPPPDEWNGDLLGYYIGYKPTSSGQPYSYRTSEFRPNASHEFFLTGLQRGTEYAVIVKAYNAAGSGVASHELHVKTLDGDVPPPPKVFVSGTTHSSITVTWHQQFASGVRGYVLYHRPEESTQDWKEVNLDSRSSSYTVSGLESGVLYQMYVSSTNEYGTGDPSEIITVRTHKAGGVMQSPIFGDASTPLYLNLFIMIPVLASLVTIVLVVIVTCVCLQRIKRRPPQPPLQPPPGTMERRSKQFAAGFDGQPQMTSTSARHAEKAQQAAGEYTGLSQRYVEVQPPPLPADHPCALYPAPCATLPMTEELEAKMARHNVNQEMKTFLAQNRELPTLPMGAKSCMSIKKDHMYESAQ